MNDNFSEDIWVGAKAKNDFFYPAAGVRASRMIVKHICLTLGVQYNYGIMQYDVNYRKTDYLKNVSNSGQSFSQTVSALTINGGFQMQFASDHRRRIHRHRHVK